MNVKPIGTSLWIVEGDVGLEFARIADHRDTVTAEVTITSQVFGEIHWARVNLVSTQGRDSLIRAARVRDAETDWPRLVNAACRAIVRHLRAGDPSVALEPRARDVDRRFLIDGVVPSGETTVMFGDGGAGKSYLALALVISGLLGHPLSPRWAVRPVRRALYLDWESDRTTHEERLDGLTRDRELTDYGSILYRRLYRPLSDHFEPIKAEIDQLGVDLVVCDSLGAAAGPEPESGDAAIRTLMTLRGLGDQVTKLVVAHVSKQSADSTGPARPFGSVYVQNLARSTVEVRREDASVSGGEGREMRLTLYHRKSNAGALVKASALRFLFDESGRIDISGAEPDLAGAGLPAQILDALKYGAKTVAELTEETGASDDVARKTLGRLEKRGRVLRLVEGGSGRGAKSSWGLAEKSGTQKRDISGTVDLPDEPPPGFLDE